MQPSTTSNPVATEADTLFDYVVIGNKGCNEGFRQWKRKSWTAPVAQVSGEWSESPYHSGQGRFSIDATSDFSHIRIRATRGVPSPVVLVARILDNSNYPFALPHIIRALEESTAYGWPSIDECKLLDTRVTQGHLVPSRSRGAGRLVLDAESSELIASKNARKERAERKSITARQRAAGAASL